MTHVQDRMINVSEILALRTTKVNKGKFTLEIRPLNGQAHALNTCARCIDATIVKIAMLPLFSILSDYLKWQRIPTAVDSCQIDLNQYRHKNKMILDREERCVTTLKTAV